MHPISETEPKHIDRTSFTFSVSDNLHYCMFFPKEVPEKGLVYEIVLICYGPWDVSKTL